MRPTIYTIVVILASLVLINMAKADTFSPPPPYLKDGIIKVTLTDGNTYTFSSNTWMVVPRLKAEPPLSPEPEQKILVAPAEKAEDSKNRFTLHGGSGRTGLSVITTPGVVEVLQDRGFVFGGTYSRKISERFSLSGTWLSNDTVTLGIGYDF